MTLNKILILKIILEKHGLHLPYQIEKSRPIWPRRRSWSACSSPSKSWVSASSGRVWRHCFLNFYFYLQNLFLHLSFHKLFILKLSKESTLTRHAVYWNATGRPGGVNIICAPPGTGKTCFGCELTLGKFLKSKKNHFLIVLDIFDIFVFWFFFWS